jgi:hypothetical protein
MFVPNPSLAIPDAQAGNRGSFVGKNPEHK